MMADLLFQTELRIHSSIYTAIICSDYGLSPLRHQAILQTNDGISLIGLLETNWNFNQNTKMYKQENEYKHVVCNWNGGSKMSV